MLVEKCKAFYFILKLDSKQSKRKPPPKCLLIEKLNQCKNKSNNQPKAKNKNQKKQNRKHKPTSRNNSKVLSQSDIKKIVENQPPPKLGNNSSIPVKFDHNEYEDRDEYIDYFKYIKKIEPTSKRGREMRRINPSRNNNRVIIHVKNIRELIDEQSKQNEKDSFSSNQTESTSLSQSSPYNKSEQKND
jgi:hypothetical protein